MGRIQCQLGSKVIVVEKISNPIRHEDPDISDAFRAILSALLGASGDEVVHGVLEMMYAKAPYTGMQRMVPIHPTVSELLPTVLADMKPA